jgi:hypothetical protein
MKVDQCVVCCPLLDSLWESRRDETRDNDVVKHFRHQGSSWHRLGG